MLIVNNNEEAKNLVVFAWYTRLEYIESDGNQYIDSWYNPNYNTELSCKFAHNEHTIDTPVFWTRWYNSANQYTLWSHPTEYGTSTWLSQCLFNSTQKQLVNYAQWTVLEFYYNKSWWKYWNTTFTWSTRSWSPWYTMIIFGLKTQNTIDSRRFSWKMRYFKISENWVLKRDLYPVKRNSDNVVGMYDTVNKIFYQNLWAWSFTAWPNV